MAYADVGTVAVNDVLTAAHVNAVRTNQEHFARNRPSAKVRNSAAQSIPNNTNTAITWDTEDFDIGGMHSAGTNPSRVTVPAGEDGKLLWIGGGEFAASATGDRQAGIRTDGVSFQSVQRVRAASAGATILAVSAMRALGTAGYGELIVLQDSGGALDFTATLYSHLSAMWMAL